MELSQEVRYRRYQDWTDQEKQTIKENVARSPWRAHYHIEPKTGLLNDPNGFSYFNGKYTLFYQSWPFGAAHGLKQWVHLESSDLVHFNETGIKLLPDHENDSQGAYSGSAYEIEDRLFLLYTGNVRDANWVRDPRQIGAWMTKDGTITKCDKVLISQPQDVTEHFRDPQIFTYENQFYAIVGAQSLDKKGFIKLYKAINNDVENWEFVGDLDFDNSGSEYMIECPNLVFVDGKPVLIYSPQGLSKGELDYRNIYPNTYKIFETFDPENAKLVGPSPLMNLDYGFEAYATQAFNAPDGNVYAISWIGLPDIYYPTDQYDYQGAMSLVKELHIKDGQLTQTPVSAIQELARPAEKLEDRESTSNSYQLAIKIAANDVAELLLFADKEGKGLRINLDRQKQELTIDRSQVGAQYATEFGTKRSCQIPDGDVTLNIYSDQSILEIFVNGGQAVLTSRVFPTKEQSGIKLVSGKLDGHFYEMR